MPQADCIFCHLPQTSIVLENDLAVAFWDIGTIPCQVDTYKNENTIFLIRPNRGNIPPRFGHFF
ncbi:hypothetical protein FAM18121_02136 [Lacticaseibacillus paracasei]|nr:hypothetical protein FAM18121_02136 [Lacticaseibacillus paracasei]